MLLFKIIYWSVGKKENENQTGWPSYVHSYKFIQISNVLYFECIQVTLSPTGEHGNACDFPGFQSHSSVYLVLSFINRSYFYYIMQDLRARYYVGWHICDCSKKDEVSTDVGSEGGVFWLADFASPEINRACEWEGGNYFRKAKSY